ncbi:autotransporter assembly complex protein TamA [Thiohalocapsa marina]|uniref:autotransporter assembly complex protein TamA n=1 Tax=Thiohalocapsa marina TaxID=424902 RepID=UPI0036D7EF54
MTGRAPIALGLALGVGALMAAWLPASPVLAAAEQGQQKQHQNSLPYLVRIEPVGDARLDQILQEASMLMALRDEAAVGAFALIARAEQDGDRLDRVLRSFGYYDAVIQIRIDALTLDHPGLVPMLLGRLPGGPIQVSVTIDTGPIYRLGQVTLAGRLPTATRIEPGLTIGEPAQAAPIIAAGEALLLALREDGFPFARVPAPEAIVDHHTRTMVVIYQVEPGPRAPLGEIDIIGLQRLREGFVRRRLGLRPGERYSPTRLEAARRALTASEAVASARLTPAAAPDAKGRVPLRLEVAERAPRVLRLAAAYSSDEGGSLALTWIHRNLFGGAERLSLGAELSQISAGQLGDINDSATAALRLPDVWRRDLDLELRLGAVSERLDAYDRDAVTVSALLEKRRSARLLLGAGIGFERASVQQDGPSEDFQLLSLPLSARWDGRDDRLDPRRGLRLEAQLSPTAVLQGGDQAFVRARLLATAYLDLSGPNVSDPVTRGQVASSSNAPGPPLLGRRVLAARLALGRILGADASAVPPDWRFYAGGGGSVRGYAFQSVGPRTASGSPAGGDALFEGSLELRQRLGARWGLAGFADVGAVSADGFQGLDDLAIGVGLGLRYHTLVGPVRVDLATPLTQTEDTAPVQLYIGIGQAF